MLNVWVITIVVVLYLGVLFVLAFAGDKYGRQRPLSPFVYGLATAIHCTSWAFFGTVTQASQHGWAIIPTYVGMSLSMIFAFGVIKRVAKYCRQHNISSLADFVGFLYGGSHSISASISLICFIGVVPYIALQLDALTMSIGLLTGLSESSSATVSFYIAAAMALFAILFGTRTLFLADKHPGLMLTIAFESVVKLIAFLLIAYYVCYQLFDGVTDIFLQAANHTEAVTLLERTGSPLAFISHVILGACCMFILPRQFHVNFVENNNDKELHTARWLLPLFLLCMTLFVMPIALAGHILLPAATLNTDSFALAIPLHKDNPHYALIAFVGGLSAATSMIIVSTLAMGIMIANNIATPLLLRLTIVSNKQSFMSAAKILTVRRITIAIVVGAAYLYYVNISKNAPLVSSGVIAMALMAQVLVPMLFGLYWRGANQFSAQCGLVTGLIGWYILLLHPSIMASYYAEPQPTSQTLGLGFLVSLATNTLTYVCVGLLRTLRRKPNPAAELTEQGRTPDYYIRLQNLLSLAEKALDEQSLEELRRGVEINQTTLSRFAAPSLINRFDTLLAERLGSPGARILLSTLETADSGQVDDLVDWVEKVQGDIHFNHEVLQSSVQHIQQGIVVVDNDIKLLAWNERYLDLFDYPKSFIKVGLSVRDILAFNANRGLLGDKDSTEIEIEKRLNHIKAGHTYKHIRKQTDGRVIELSGSPLPGGGYVTTFSDITEYIQIQDELEHAKVGLEKRVAERTQQLDDAREQAEQANASKTRFLAAAGHDLMQPFNAAALFAEMLQQKTQDTQLAKLSNGLTSSLQSAESLLTALLDITKLESGAQKVNQQQFRVNDILKSLHTAMLPLAEQKGLRFHYVPSSVWIESDPALLKRIVQNLLANAIRYTHSGGIVFGVKHLDKHSVNLLVADSGVGIAAHDQHSIFNEFYQLNPKENVAGLGLGLTIVARTAELLQHPISLSSQPGIGTSFSVSVPKVTAQNKHPANSKTNEDQTSKAFLNKQTVMIIENDNQIATALSALVTDWGAHVIVANDLASAEQQCEEAPFALILDYQLDNNANGLDAAVALYERWQSRPLSVLSSANMSSHIREKCVDEGIHYLPKPLKTLALKRLFKQALGRQHR